MEETAMDMVLEKNGEAAENRADLAWLEQEKEQTIKNHL